MTGQFSVTHRPEESRYVLLDEAKAGSSETVEAGELTYVDTDERIFTHTRVVDEYAGQGLASLLVGEGVDDTIAADLRFVALCSYIVNWLSKHPEYSAHAVTATPTHLKAVSAH